MKPPLLQLNNITKRYGSSPALKSVNLDLMPGEIHGLVGENGAGKSTLLKILLGNSEIAKTGGFSGSIYWQGKPVHISGPREAAGLGIGMVHQEFSLIPDFDAARNISMGRENLHPWTRTLLGSELALIDRREELLTAEKALRNLGLTLNPGLKVARLPASVKQMIELARECSREDLKLLILDEPSSSLGEEDAGRMLQVLKRMAERGISVLLVSHRLQEICSICQRITVLRDGEVAARFDSSDADYDLNDIIRAMLGRDIIQQRYREPLTAGPTILSLRGFSVDMPGEELHDLDLDVMEGEIIGLTGLSGHGRSAVGNGLMGLFPVKGAARLDGIQLDPGHSPETISQGLYLLPDERRMSGLLLEQSVLMNIIFASMQQNGRFLKPFPVPALRWMDRRSAVEWTRKMISAFDIRCQSIHQPVHALSGGNQQKVCLARALSLSPRVLFIHEPTRGIDIGAREIILKTLVNMNQEQAITLVCASGELSELATICDRIAVFESGRLTHIIHDPADFPQAI